MIFERKTFTSHHHRHALPPASAALPPPSSAALPPRATHGASFPENRLITPGHWVKLDPAAPGSLLTRLLKEAGDVPLAHAASKTAKLNTDTQQGELAALYPEAQALAVSLMNTIEYNLGERPDLDAPGRRRIARAWGVIYINDDGSVD